MADYKKYVEKLKNPEKIKEALYASSPYVLRKAFQNDPTVNLLIKAGSDVVPIIKKELTECGLKLDEITLSCFVYILEHIELESLPPLVKPLLRKAVEKPGPFFVHFAAHALRQAVRLPVRPLDMVYRKSEVLETLEKL